MCNCIYTKRSIYTPSRCVQAMRHARELYRAVPQWCLEWPHRLRLLVSEIRHWRPDIAGLQEVDHLDDFVTALGVMG